MNIRVSTERDEDRANLAEADLRALIARIGADGDHFVVVARVPDEPDHYIQTWHETGEGYDVEYRDGGQDRHYATELTDPAEVADLLVAWINRAENWQGAYEWRRMDFPEPDLDGLPDEVRDYARTHVHAGYRSFPQIVSDLVEHFDVDPVTRDQAGAVVGEVWNARIAEQPGWPEITDPDRLTEAFDRLTANGVVARQDFTCCRNCGLSEIAAEAAEGDRGFVFFHSQDTERVANGEALWLAFGSLPDSPDDTETIGHEVVAALTAAGLPVDWNGSPDRRIRVTPLDWKKRLPAT